MEKKKRKKEDIIPERSFFQYISLPLEKISSPRTMNTLRIILLQNESEINFQFSTLKRETGKSSNRIPAILLDFTPSEEEISEVTLDFRFFGLGELSSSVQKISIFPKKD